MSTTPGDFSLKDRGTYRSPYEMADDPWVAFRQSVNNGQVRLAMEYLLRLLHDMQGTIESLGQELEHLKESKAAAVAAAPPRRKTTPKEQPVESTVE